MSRGPHPLSSVFRPLSFVSVRDLLHYRQHTLVSLWVSAYAQISGGLLLPQCHHWRVELDRCEWHLQRVPLPLRHPDGRVHEPAAARHLNRPLRQHDDPGDRHPRPLLPPARHRAVKTVERLKDKARRLAEPPNWESRHLGDDRGAE